MGAYSKLQDKKIGPFIVSLNLGPNAYVLDLPLDLHIYPTFNVKTCLSFTLQMRRS